MFFFFFAVIYLLFSAPFIRHGSANSTSFLLPDPPQLDERLKREGFKTHKERVEELNRYLSNLSEHHDMYVRCNSSNSPLPPGPGLILRSRRPREVPSYLQTHWLTPPFPLPTGPESDRVNHCSVGGYTFTPVLHFVLTNDPKQDLVSCP